MPAPTASTVMVTGRPPLVELARDGASPPEFHGCLEVIGGVPLACLERISEHLLPGGRLVLHVANPDVAWLKTLQDGRGGMFEAPEELTGSGSSSSIRTLHAWRYEPASQTLSFETVWEEIEHNGSVVRRWERGPVLLRCVFPFEMEDLLARTKFALERVYGDFSSGPLVAESSEMIWVARKPE
ncbi:MAG: hypothetical protein HY682_01255 [Chloroflexi bacterium]|nr:hypothetical protein [Chloroflexota bacterium]